MRTLADDQRRIRRVQLDHELRGAARSTLVATFRRLQLQRLLQPIDKLPAINTVKAGSAVPVKFSLGGDMGLDISRRAIPHPEP